ncbi:MAG: hypothetical protein ACR2MT_13105 [Aurantibacter sp.]
MNFDLSDCIGMDKLKLPVSTTLPIFNGLSNTSTMYVHRHSLYDFELIEAGKILLFTWSDATKNMTVEDYREALHNYAGFGSEYKVPAMLVDVRNFKYQMTPELGIWRDKEISPRYAKFGLRKFGYIVPLGVVSKIKDTMTKVERSFEEDYFETEKEAIDWLTK